MHRLEIPIAEMNAFDLPRVCLITGATEGVEFRKVKFAWYPRWVAFFALPALLVAAILAAVLTKRAKGELPFSPHAYRWWKLGQALFVLVVFAAIAGLLASVVIATNGSGAVAVAVALVSIAGAIGAWWGLLRNKTVQVVRITDSMLTLKVPSQTAVGAFQQQLKGGAARPRAVVA